MGVYDAERDEFATVTKIGTGLSDAEAYSELAELVVAAIRR